MEKESALNRFAFLNLGIISKQEPEKAPLSQHQGLQSEEGRVFRRPARQPGWLFRLAGLPLGLGSFHAGADRTPSPKSLWPPRFILPITMRTVRALNAMFLAQRNCHQIAPFQVLPNPLNPFG